MAPLVDALPMAPQGVVIALVTGVASPILIPIGAVVVLLGLGLKYLAWSRFHYSIEERNLVVESGLLSRNRRVVPLDRIQQVDLQRKLRHRLSGLAVVRVDTAGVGDTPEVALEGVTVAEADRLRRVLRHGNAAPAPFDGDAWPSGAATGPEQGGWVTGPAPAVEPEREVVSLGYGRLALAGITGSGLLVVFAVLGSLIGLAEQFTSSSAATEMAEQVFDAADDGPPSLLVMLGVIALVLPLWLLTGAVASVVTDGGFTMTLEGDQIRVRRGLLDQREVGMAIHRVQVATIRANGLRRVLGLASVSFRSAGGSAGIEGAATDIRVPLLTKAEVETVLAAVMPSAPTSVELHPAPPAARRRAIVRRVAPATIAALGLIVAAFLGGDPWQPWAPLALVLPVLAGLHGEAAYRALGWANCDGHIHTRTGAVSRAMAVVPVAKVQSTRLSTSFFQRRAALATLWLDVAGGGAPHIPDGAGDSLRALRTAALATTEARRDEAAVRRRATAGRESEMIAT